MYQTGSPPPSFNDSGIEDNPGVLIHTAYRFKEGLCCPRHGVLPEECWPVLCAVCSHELQSRLSAVERERDEARNQLCRAREENVLLHELHSGDMPALHQWPPGRLEIIIKRLKELDDLIESAAPCPHAAKIKEAEEEAKRDK